MLLLTDPGEAVALVAIAIAFGTVTVKLLGPIMQGLGKRLGGREGTGDPALRAEVEELRARVHELEGQQARVLELEERLDFTERLLVRQREQDPARLERGG